MYIYKYIIPCDCYPRMFCRAFCILPQLQNAMQNINRSNSSVSEVILSYKMLPKASTKCLLLTILMSRYNTESLKKSGLGT